MNWSGVFIAQWIGQVSLLLTMNKKRPTEFIVPNFITVIGRSVFRTLTNIKDEAFRKKS